MAVITFGVPVGEQPKLGSKSGPRVELTSIPGPDRRVIVRAHIDAITGYGQHACQLVRGLRALGVDVAIRPMQTWEQWGLSISEEIKSLLIPSDEEIPEGWELLISPPHHDGTEGKRTVHFTMWESNRLPRGSADRLSRCAAVIVPCEWCQVSFDASGVAAPIYKVPLGIDTETYSPRKWRTKDGPIVFGCGGRVAHGGLRKGIEQVLRTWQKEFPVEDDVRLEIKVFPDCKFPEVDDPRITVHRVCWTDEQMAEWYRGLTAYATMAYAEGFGLMPLQAMSCGKPVIGVAATGQAEYLDESVGYPVRYTLERATDLMPGNGFYEGYWYVPDEDGVRSRMRQVYENREDAHRRGVCGSVRAQEFTWEVMARRVLGVLRKVGMLEG